MLSVEPLKAYDDNYIWLVSTNEGSIVVDPGESNKIIDLMNKNKINLKDLKKIRFDDAFFKIMSSMTSFNFFVNTNFSL